MIFSPSLRHIIVKKIKIPKKIDFMLQKENKIKNVLLIIINKHII